MKKFNVKINGKNYEVEVEEVGGVSSSATVAPAVATSVSEASAQPAAPKPAAGANVVSAPMPGTILKINVKAGDAVKKGDVLCVLEAMKMENDIKAAADGTVAAVHASQGASVNTGDALVSLN